jgi:hypothetical protein
MCIGSCFEYSPGPKIMKETDIIRLTNNYGNSIIRCKICGSTSGTDISSFTHKPTCEYYINHSISIIKHRKPDVVLKTQVEPGSIFPVYQKEVHIATPEHPIIGTFGLGPCVCIIMRDPVTTKTMLAHIDAYTIDPIGTFDEHFMDSSEINLYIVGGNDSIDLTFLLEILNKLELNENRYNIKLLWMIDDRPNDVSIDSRNGDIYLNLKGESVFMKFPMRFYNMFSDSRLYKI